MSFVRKFDKDKTEVLLDSKTDVGKFFIGRVRPYVKNGKLFMGIRVNKLDFYSGGNRFLVYDGKSFKYVPKIYGEDGSGSLKPIDIGSFTDNFDKRVEICKRYSSPGSNVEQYERKIIQSFLPHFDRHERIIVLDREIRINDGNGIKVNGIKVDWLLFNTETKQLKFAEVKTDDNKSLHSKENGRFKVENQLDRYSEQYGKNEKLIIEQYKVYVKIVNTLLETSIPAPEKFLDTKAGLAIFKKTGSRINCDLLEKTKAFYGDENNTLESIWNHFDE